MLTFDQFLEKTMDLKWPNDCNGDTILRKVGGDKCFMEPGGSHDKIKEKAFGTTVTVIPRHRQLNPYTCKTIMRDLKKAC